MDKAEKVFLKKAQVDMFSAAGGLTSGYYTGRQMASNTANMLSNYGYKTKNESTAKNVATVAAPVGALAGMAFASRNKPRIMREISKHLKDPELQQLASASLPFAAGAAGGGAAGVASGALASLRGKFKNKG